MPDHPGERCDGGTGCNAAVGVLVVSLVSVWFSFVQIYQLPDWRLVFLVKNFPVGQRVLVDSSSGQSATQGEKEGKKEELTRQGEIPLVKEVTLVSLGYNHSRPYLLVGFVSEGPKKKDFERFLYLNHILVYLGSRGSGTSHLRSLSVRSAAAAEQPESALQKSKSRAPFQTAD